MLFHSTFEAIPGATGDTTCETLKFGFEGKDFYVHDDSGKRGLKRGTSASVVYHFNKNPNDMNIDFNGNDQFKFPCKLDLQDGADGVSKFFTMTVTTEGFAGCDVVIQLVSPFFYH